MPSPAPYCGKNECLNGFFQCHAPISHFDAVFPSQQIGLRQGTLTPLPQKGLLS